MNRRTIAGYSVLMLLPVIANTASANTLDGTISVLKSKPYQTATLDDSENRSLFNKYCIGDANSADAPQPNYNDPLVKAAAAKLSATKSVSSQRLFDNAVREIQNNIASAKAQCESLAKHKDPAVAALAQELVKEIEKTDAKEGFSPAAKALFEKLSASFASPVQNAANTLGQNLPNELQGIDFTVLAQIMDGLNAEISPLMKPVDFNALKKATNEIEASLVGEIKPSDINVIKSAVATLIAQIPAGSAQAAESAKQQLEYMKQVLAQQQLDAYTLTFYIDNSLRYVEQAVSLNALTLNAEASQAYNSLKAQVGALQNSNVLTAVQQLKQKLASDLPDSDINQYNEIMWEAQSLLGAVKGLGSTVSAKTAALIAPFESEVVKFGSGEILQSFNLFKQQMSAGQSQQAMYTASNLIYSLKDLPQTQKTDKIISLQAKLEFELTKSQSSGILESVKQFQQMAAAAGGKLTDELIGMATNLQYSLQQIKSAVKPETAKAIDTLLAVSNELTSLNNIKLNMNVQAPAAVQSQHFYFYSAVNRIYLPSPAVPVTAPEGTQPEAHQFLTQLCGEFRDRATMIHAKLKWATNIFILPAGQPKTFTINVNKNVWSQVPASAYTPYIGMTRRVWDAKRQKLARFITVGDNSQVDNPVPGFTVCETKYIFSEYVGKGRAFDNFDNYAAGYKTYREACTPDDRRDFYDFRGDSNFKHYSPESNGMIWYATTIARACKNPTTARPNQNGITDDDCRKYFTKPFFYRYNAARAGLASWLFRDDKHAAQFAAQGKMVAIYPHRSPELAPFSFSYDQTNATADVFEFDQNWLSTPGGWNTPDIGFNAFTGLGSQQPDYVKAYQRIRDAVDRHTDWYNSGYNDKNGTMKDQAYSPFVASSYDPSASDGFTSCGTTVQCPNDGLKRWMFVFRVKPENWYTPARLIRNEPVNFDKMWFDETAFGDSGLANSEKAMDRLGTAYEGEFDSILYLVNVGLNE